MKYSITKYNDRYSLKINNVTFYDTHETIIQLIKFLSKENKDLQQRINKTIEYINKCRFNEVLIDLGSEYDYEQDYFEDKILSILKG